MAGHSFQIFFLALLLVKLAVKTYLNLLNYRYLQKNAGAVPDELQEVVNPDTLQRIDSYQAAHTVFHICSDWLATVLLALFLFTPLFATYTGIIDGTSFPYAVKGILFFLILGCIDWICNLPFDYYFHFHLEARFGFNKYLPATWLWDSAKGLLLNSGLSAVILGFVFSIWGNNFHFQWRDVLAGWALSLLLMVVLQYLVPVLVIPFFYKLAPLPEGELKDKVTELVNGSGFKVRGIYVANESSKSNHANAMFAGIGAHRSIILFDTLVNQYSTPEILGVLAHEIGHGKKRHTVQLLFLEGIQIFLFILCASLLLGMNWPYRAMGISKIFYSGSFFIFILFFNGFFFFIQPALSWYVRNLEYQADAFSKDSLGTGAPLIATFKKFVTEELSNIHPHPWYEAFYYSHPSLLKRIRALEK